MDDYLQLQAVQQFATAAARDAALTARKREGMVTYQLDTNTLTVYSGAAWSTIGPTNSALTAWTPAVTQSGAVTGTVTTGTYSRVGRRVFFEVLFAVTGSGTAANVVTVSLPVTALSGNPHSVIGLGYIYDSSATAAYKGEVVMASTTTVKFFANVTSAAVGLTYFGTSLFTAGLAVNDVITLTGNYEAAGDA
jgi:hypothetical protein